MSLLSNQRAFSGDAVSNNDANTGGESDVSVGSGPLGLYGERATLVDGLTGSGIIRSGHGVVGFVKGGNAAVPG